jgi:hypothetical protein
VLGCLIDMAPSILITTPILLPVVMKFGVDPVHFGMIMLMNLGIGLCHPPVGATLFVGCAVGGQDGRRDARDLAVLRGVSCPDAGDLRPDDIPVAAAPAVAVTWPTTKALTPLSLWIVFSHDQIHGDFVLRAA